MKSAKPPSHCGKNAKLCDCPVVCKHAGAVDSNAGEMLCAVTDLPCVNMLVLRIALQHFVGLPAHVAREVKSQCAISRPEKVTRKRADLNKDRICYISVHF